ncbi:MAG: alkaline phosphatase family protein, partial [Candidatus Latescibacteria bacterium]|nr:alkaline phosphatase family protein [Candidatus Latescibacterota bacterium]
PHLNRLIGHGVSGSLTSCIPCITVPAWSVMTSGKDPGVLGIYGFRNRADYSYDRMTIATGAAVQEPRVWDVLSQAGKRVVTIGIPGTYPPRPVNGAQVGCFLTPQTVRTDDQGRTVSTVFTYPPELSQRVNEWAGGEYLVDVKQFRTDEKESLLRRIYDMTRQHFDIVRAMMQHQPWDFFMFVEMGPDRAHHGFWKYHDPEHRQYEPEHLHAHAIRDYYRYLDGEIGDLLGRLDDDTAVIVVSDHGVKRMDGGICVNEWLLRAGWLALADGRPEHLTPLNKVGIDWSRTKAWGEGGYYARVFLNVAGREPQGIVPQDAYDRVRDELADQLTGIRGPHGEDIGTVVYKPRDIYRTVNRVAPDLIVYFGNLLWRSVGSLGHDDVWTFENDTGPDDANHAPQGMFIYDDPRQDFGGRELSGLEIMDVAPTVLDHFGLPVPPDMQGRVIRFEEHI